MKTLEELQNAATWSDEELDRLVDGLRQAESAVRPLGREFVCVLNEIVRRLSNAESIQYMRRIDADRQRRLSESAQ